MIKNLAICIMVALPIFVTGENVCKNRFRGRLINDDEYKSPFHIDYQPHPAFVLSMFFLATESVNSIGLPFDQQYYKIFV